MTTVNMVRGQSPSVQVIPGAAFTSQASVASLATQIECLPSLRGAVATMTSGHSGCVV